VDSKLPSVHYHLAITVENMSGDLEDISIDHKNSASNVDRTNIAPRVDTTEYVCVSGFKGGDAKRLACDPKMRHLKLVPVYRMVYFSYFALIFSF
jgi:hypothetical protein